MLDTDTKRRIDSCRDMLVGKVPDPKSQVEQITIALIYKFMDDMDAEAEELGGKRTFFAGDFAKYGWSKLMAPSMGGFDILNLYSEAIQKMNENPGIPALFRDIFKNAYLPYRDPETLRSFLKEINGFTYDHSEKLGDAFEYLLSVLGSQGDAGQFRTPRHIIDFIVQVIDPQKDETILDPACGTAGFLISSYKHILKTNTKVPGQGQPGDCLTPEERTRLAKHIHGYDISPDMVRLSLVNLYLHGFTSPRIEEYDTLTSEDKWNEYADVILANPPFMSPTGGIKPHKRFSVQATRSEVLFVDYIAEHLTPNGRAGVIVPEGIIFQSGIAYRSLREMLVKNSLVAVVSLPAGLFNPYSGVKTSILILDKRLAKKADTILFVKVENDGFNLGAQRRAIEKDDLPQALDVVSEYLRKIRTGAPISDYSPAFGLVVDKAKIAADGDFNLSGERYRQNGVISSTWPLVPVGDVFRRSGKTVQPSTLRGPVTYVGLENISQDSGHIIGDTVVETPSEIKSLKAEFSENSILYGKLRPNLNKVWLSDRSGVCSTDILVIMPVNDRTLPSFYSNIFRSKRFNDSVMTQLKGAQLPRVGWESFAALQIPLPPLDIQKQIVAEIDGYQMVIDGARAVLDNYRPHIPIRPEWPVVTLGTICSFKNGLNFSKESSGHSVRMIGVGDFQSNLYAPLDDLNTVELDAPLSEEYLVREGDILFVRSNGNPALVGRSVIVPEPTEPTTFSGFTIRARITDTNVSPIFLAHLFKSRDFAEMIKTVGRGANIRNLSQALLNELAVPLPPLEIQHQIVAEIEAEQALVDANGELVSRLEKKIHTTIARVWEG